LLKYKVGLGYENFATEDGSYKEIPVVYFPLFAKRSAKEISKLKEEQRMKEENENQINNIYYEIVKAKARGIGKENKSYMRLKPSG